MIENKEQYVQVQNLTDNPVVYVIDEDNIRRDFGPYETKSIAKDELQKLYYKAGGATLIRDFLRIQDKKLAVEYGVDPDTFEHEYSWDRRKVDDVLQNGSLDLLNDALDFAPEGIVELIIQRAIALRIPDINKRKLIFDCTGKDINAMIANQVALEQAVEQQEEEKPKQRRVTDNASQEKKDTAVAGRRVQ